MAQNVDWILSKIVGAREFYERFESWPSFHDAEIVELHLVRNGTSSLKVAVEKFTLDVDSSGDPITEKFAVILRMVDIQEMFLNDFNDQNVIFELTLGPVENGIEIGMHPTFGMYGRIVARRVSLEYISLGI